ncbi:unnamed protein product [Chrysoparadoxa australica]
MGNTNGVGDIKKRQRRADKLKKASSAGGGQKEAEDRGQDGEPADLVPLVPSSQGEAAPAGTESRMPPGMGKLSSKRFLKDDNSSTQWKIFNELDVHDDAMMVELAVFLRQLMASQKAGMPGSTSLKKVGAEEGESPPRPVLIQRQASNYLEGEEEDALSSDEDERSQASTASSVACRKSNTLNLDKIQVVQDNMHKVPELVRIGSVDVRLGSVVENLNDYTLPKGPLTINSVHELVQLYAAGGKLNIKSVRKILRDAYKALKASRNVVHVDIEQGQTCTVVGDIHGQLPDLLHLLNANGMPHADHKYIFNGDFVDRGVNGVEVLLILFLLLTVMPESVALNRGNHEDFGLCCVYGFQKECMQKYDEVIFSMFCEMFRHLPICSVLAKRVIVIHGGLFHREGVTLAELDEVERTEYVVPSRLAEEKAEHEMNSRELRAKDLRTLMHCALWSDPDIEDSLPEPEPNPRGAGVLFGPDMLSSFLNGNDLAMLVRSHECVEDGFDLPYEGEQEGACCTIFSASNYGQSMNQGATMTFSWEETDESFVAGGETALQMPLLYYTVLVYNLSAEEEGDELAPVVAANQTGLFELILRKRKLIQEAFSQVDQDEDGWVTKDKWAGVMATVTGMRIAWPALVSLLVSEDDIDGDMIQWRSFLDKFHVQLKAGGGKGDEAVFDAVYSNREQLEAIFRFFDADNNGYITREEFTRGCELINENLPAAQRLQNTDAILNVMDFDQDDAVDINEFFEVFRLVGIQSPATPRKPA